MFCENGTSVVTCAISWSRKLPCARARAYCVTVAKTKTGKEEKTPEAEKVSSAWCVWKYCLLCCIFKNARNICTINRVTRTTCFSFVSVKMRLAHKLLPSNFTRWAINHKWIVDINFRGVKLKNIISIIPLLHGGSKIYFQRYVGALGSRRMIYIRERFLFELRNGQMANVGGGKIM